MDDYLRFKVEIDARDLTVFLGALPSRPKPFARGPAGSWARTTDTGTRNAPPACAPVRRWCPTIAC